MFYFLHKNIDFAHKIDNPSSPTEDYFKHIHGFNEILYFVRGQVKYTVESETLELREGDLVFIPSGKYHFATVDLSVPYERYVFKFSDSLVPEYMREKLANNGSFYSNCKKYEVIFNQFDNYFKQYSDNELYTLFMCETIKLLVSLMHNPLHPAKTHNSFIESVIAYIDSNIRKPITMQTLSDEFHYSKSFIKVEFKRQMKIPIMQYVRSKKIIAAHHMILSGTKKHEAAEMFGFETYSTFYRAYKKFIELNEIDSYDI